MTNSSLSFLACRSLSLCSCPTLQMSVCLSLTVLFSPPMVVFAVASCVQNSNCFHLSRFLCAHYGSFGLAFFLNHHVWQHGSVCCGCMSLCVHVQRVGMGKSRKTERWRGGLVLQSNGPSSLSLSQDPKETRCVRTTQGREGRGGEGQRRAWLTLFLLSITQLHSFFLPHMAFEHISRCGVAVVVD